MNSPLEAQFNEFDTDKDGKIDDTQTYQLLKMLGKNVYSGTVRQAIKHLNYRQPEVKHITFNQFKQYFESFETQSKHTLWKYKYQVLYSIQQITEGQGGKGAGLAAPGVMPEKQNPTTGNISLKIGPQNVPYESFVEFEVEKKNKEEVKPFLKIVFEQSSAAKAQSLSQKINALYKQIMDLLKGDVPQYLDLFDSIHLITNVSGNKVNLFVTSSNPLLIEIGELCSEYLDRILGSPFDLFYHIKHEFNFDITKFADSHSDYTFYEALTKNTKTNIKWEAFNFKNSAKNLLKIHKAFDELLYDKASPPQLMLIGALHMDSCELDLSFDNSDFSNPEMESKGMFLAFVKELTEELSSKEIKFKQVLEDIENKISIEASLGNWKVKQNMDVKHLNKLFLAEIGDNVGNVNDYIDSD